MINSRFMATLKPKKLHNSLDEFGANTVRLRNVHETLKIMNHYNCTGGSSRLSQTPTGKLSDWSKRATGYTKAAKSTTATA